MGDETRRNELKRGNDDPLQPDSSSRRRRKE